MGSLRTGQQMIIGMPQSKMHLPNMNLGSSVPNMTSMETLERCRSQPTRQQMTSMNNVNNHVNNSNNMHRMNNINNMNSMNNGGRTRNGVVMDQAKDIYGAPPSVNVGTSTPSYHSYQSVNYNNASNSGHGGRNGGDFQSAALQMIRRLQIEVEQLLQGRGGNGNGNGRGSGNASENGSGIQSTQDSFTYGIQSGHTQNSGNSGNSCSNGNDIDNSSSKVLRNLDIIDPHEQMQAQEFVQPSGCKNDSNNTQFGGRRVSSGEPNKLLGSGHGVDWLSKSIGNTHTGTKTNTITITGSNSVNKIIIYIHMHI